MVADRFRLRYRLTPEHYQSFSGLAFKRLKKPRTWKSFLKALPFGIGIGLIVGLLGRTPYLSESEARILLIGVAIGVVLIFGFSFIMLKAAKASPPLDSWGAMTGEFKLAAYDGGGIQVSGQHIQSSYDWSAFIDLTQGADFLVLWFGRTAGIIIPNTAFSDEQEKQSFTEFVNERIEAHKQLD